RELLSGDSTEIALSFSPITSQTFTNTAVLTYNSTLSKEGPMQGTAVTVADLRVTEVELAPQRREVEPGETLSVFLRIRREEPVKSTANEYRATIDFDRRVMEYIASDDIRPRKIQQQADRRLLDISSERNGRDTLIEMKFIAKLADVDSTSLLFNGTEPFIWSDGGGKVFPSYVDSVVYVRVCKEGGKRLVTKSPGTQLLMMSPNPGGAGTVELTYSVGERTSAELFVTDIHGRKVADIASGEHDMGTHQSTVQTSDWIEGVYMVVLRTPRETVSQKLVVVR
ncbi:MAG: T9SS type A sorting domain-containing protein, partial [Candidatus Kapabacteria bacterium]|nr:T9SS type A sorting domain-containing protein [Candidatus Kapabacteria bacterium]